MQLSRFERALFANQFRILEALYPDEATFFAQHRKALEDGWELHYDWAVQNISEDTLSEDECKEVLDILDMYRALTFGLQKLSDNHDLQNHHYARFHGFDGNHETKRMAYVRYFVYELDRFGELVERTDDDFNSHFPTLEVYRSMLEEWRKIPPPERFQLDAEGIRRVLEAARP